MESVSSLPWTGCPVWSGIRIQQEAITSFDEAIGFNPGLVLAHAKRANAYQGLMNFELAMSGYEDTLALAMDYPDGNFNLGNAQFMLGQFDGAVRSYDRAIMQEPGSAEIHYNRGNALQQLQQYRSAVESYDEAIILAPGFSKAYYGRGNALYELDQFYTAIDSYDQAIVHRPDYAQAACNRGNALRQTTQFKAALKSYENSIDLDSESTSAHWNKALLLLLTGDFALGWREYEWRWKNPSLGMGNRSFTAPLWLGNEPLKGKTILLHSEQGLGDCIQFCRYAVLVSALGANVILEVPPSLTNLMETLGSEIGVVPSGSPLPAFDFHSPLMSLPLAFRTGFAEIPGAGP